MFLFSNILYRRYQTEKLQKLINEEEANYQHIHVKSNNNVRTLSYKSTENGTDETSVKSGSSDSDGRFVKLRRKSSDSVKNDESSEKLARENPHNSIKSQNSSSKTRVRSKILSKTEQSVEKGSKNSTKSKNSTTSSKKSIFQHSGSASSKRKRFRKTAGKLKIQQHPADSSSLSEENMCQNTCHREKSIPVAKTGLKSAKQTVTLTKSLPNKLRPAVVKQNNEDSKMDQNRSLNQLNQLNIDFYNMQKPKPLVTARVINNRRRVKLRVLQKLGVREKCRKVFRLIFDKFRTSKHLFFG